jgi:hypothetical protein
VFFELSFVFYGVNQLLLQVNNIRLFLSHDGFYKNKEFFEYSTISQNAEIP